MAVDLLNIAEPEGHHETNGQNAAKCSNGQPAPKKPGDLSATEYASLEQHENTIKRHLDHFSAVGQALLAIRDGRLYRATHKTFEAYCRERWSIGRNRANRLILASIAVDDATEPAKRVEEKAANRKNGVDKVVPLGTKSTTFGGSQETGVLTVPPCANERVIREVLAVAPKLSALDDELRSKATRKSSGAKSRRQLPMSSFWLHCLRLNEQGPRRQSLPTRSGPSRKPSKSPRPESPVMMTRTNTAKHGSRNTLSRTSGGSP